MDGLRDVLEALPRGEREALLPDDMPLLTRLFPVLRGLAEPVPGRWASRSGAFSAAQQVLHNLARRQPLVLALDDLQWGDGDSAEFLSGLAEASRRVPLLLVLSYRQEHVADSPFLTAWLHSPVIGRLEQRSITLGPLSPSESEEAARRLLEDNRLPASAAEWMARECGGNPFLLRELVLHALDEHAEEVTDHGVPRSLDALVLRRVAALPAEPRELLLAVALAGRPLPLSVLGKAARLTDPLPAFTELRVRRFVRSTRAVVGELVEPYHDSIPQAMQLQTRTRELASAHLRLAAALEHSGWSEPEDLMRHYLEGGDRHRAAECAVQAAERCMDQLAFDRAAQHYRTALSLGRFDEDRVEALQLGLADALAHSGRGGEAARLYLEAAEAGAGRQLRRRAVEQLVDTGHVDEAKRHLSGLLEEIGMTLPDPAQAAWTLTAQRAWLAWRGSRPAPKRAVGEDERFAADLCWSVARAFLHFDPVVGALFHTRALQIALSTGDPWLVVRSWTLELIQIAGADKPPGTSGPLAKSARSLALEAGDHSHRARALVLTGEGVAAFLEGRFKTAVRVLAQAQQQLDEVAADMVYERGVAELFALKARVWSGQLASARQPWLEALERAERHENLLLSCHLRGDVFALLGLVDGGAAQVEKDAADIESTWSSSGYHVPHWFSARARTMALLREGRGREAQEVVEQAWRRGVQSRFHLGGWMTLQARELRGRAALAAGDVTRAEQLAVKVERNPRPIAKPLAAMLWAGVASLLGRDPRPQLRRAEEGFVRNGMELHAAVARVALGGGSMEQGLGWLENQGVDDVMGLSRVLWPVDR